ncbi:MAG: hypothetical protein KA059_06565 [Elusimicrobiales bacterium]|jgi:hypothetical protein|nr:hypothetical protein [Elusimicrobiales bacterium]NLH38549.1 hypothetical protein [Elusimicrobiota bacterium]
MNDRKKLIIFISNIVAVALLSKLLPFFIKTKEYRIERALLGYLLLSLVLFLFFYKKNTEKSN